MKTTGTGEKEVFEKLYEEYGDRVFNTVYCMLGNYHETEDVVQEIFVQAYSNLRNFRGMSRPSTWLYRITMNAVKAHIKRNSRRRNVTTDLESGEMRETIPAENGNSVENGFIDNETGGEIRAALMELPPKFREVFVLNCVEGYSYREVADILGVSIGTVESRIFRAKEGLRRRLSGLL